MSKVTLDLDGIDHPDDPDFLDENINDLVGTSVTLGNQGEHICAPLHLDNQNYQMTLVTWVI